MISGKIDAAAQSELVFISDLHVGCGVESLQGYPWPESVRLDVRQVRAKEPGNARASLLASEEGAEDQVLKVRVENNADSVSQSFELKWMAGDQPIASAPTTLQVPPGQVRIVPVPNQPATAERLMLTGDSWDGDNAVFVAKPVPKRERIAFVGAKVKNKEDDLAYFLEQAPLSTGLVRRTVERVESSALGAVLAAEDSTDGATGESLQAIVFEPPFDDSNVDALRAFADRGGCVIVCMSRAIDDWAGTERALQGLLSVEQVNLSEAVTKDFALLSGIDYSSPVFKPFADPRFNDFSKIRVWTHRKLAITTTEGDRNAQVIASLDDGSPWLVRSPIGSGNVWVLTSGWQPVSSQLGLSSKFVPILLGMLDPTGKTLTNQTVYAVGESILVDDLPNLIVTNANGEVVERDTSAETLQLDAPGVYNLQSAGLQRQVVVQVPGSESQLTPLDVDVFEQYGVELGKVQSDADRKQSARQLQAIELEQKQRVWQWLLLAGLIVLGIETVLAGWLARRSFRSNARPEPQTAG